MENPWREELDSRTNIYVRRTMGQFAALRRTCLESWARSAVTHLVPCLIHNLDPSERDLLIDEHFRRERGLPDLNLHEFSGLVERLERMVLQAQTLSPIGAAFVRLGSCAPLDSQIAQGGNFQVDGGPEALEVLLESERVFDDLCLFQECNHPGAIVIRPWLELAPEHELRAEIREGELVSLTQRPALFPLIPVPTRDPTPRQVDAVERTLPLLRDLFGELELVVDFVASDDEAALLDAYPLQLVAQPAQDSAKSR